MARLPQPGGDDGNWGTILNNFLKVTHNSDGTLKDNTVSADQISGTIPQSNITNLTDTLDAKASQTDLEDETTARIQGDTDAKNRSNHTGTQAIATVTNLQSSLDTKATLGSGDAQVMTNLENEGTYTRLSNVNGFQAHFSIAQAVGYVQWTQVDNDPLSILRPNSRDFMMPESGLYDITIAPTWSSTTGLKIAWLMDNIAKDDAATGAVIAEFDLQSAGAYGGLRFFDVPLTAGKWYRVYLAASSGTPTINTARISIRRTGDPFG